MKGITTISWLNRKQFLISEESVRREGVAALSNGRHRISYCLG